MQHLLSAFAVFLFGALVATMATAPAAAVEFPEPLPYPDYADTIKIGDYRARAVAAGGGGSRGNGGQLRLHWDGSAFIDRADNRYPAPDWFSAGFPNETIDGLLVADALDNNAIGRILRAPQAVDGWRKLTFIALDLPDADGDFDARQTQLTQRISESNLPNLRITEWATFFNPAALQEALDKMYKSGGDGYLLHAHDSAYLPAAGKLLLALPYNIGEATVLTHRRGEGDYAGMMGSMVVADDAGGEFIIALGFTRAERQTPPAVGSRIQYRYKGYTSTGKPKAPVFLQPLAAAASAPAIGGILTTTQLMWFFIFLIVLLAVLDAATHTRGGRRWNFKSAIVSTGLLGTFVGVFVGLYHFDTSDIAAGVPALLEGLKLSFVTSIVGIALSTLLSVIQTLTGTDTAD